MINVPSHTNVEVRVLRTVLSRPALIDDAPELETMDFFDLACRLIWVAAISIWDKHHPESRAEMLLLCSAYLAEQPGSLPMNSYGLIAAELRGDTSYPAGKPTADPVVMQDVDAPDVELKKRLKSDVRTLRFSRRAREQMRELQYPTLTRG
jgi:hypothetical protein